MIIMFSPRNKAFFPFIFFAFLCVPVKSLIKVDTANNIIGGSTDYMMSNAARIVTIQDIADAGADIMDLLSVLNGIALPLIGDRCNPGSTSSWLHLPRTKGGQLERLETHLLRGHGPSGGISQAHIMSLSQFSFGVVAGIQAPQSGTGLALDPNIPLTVGGVFGGRGVPVNQNWNQLQQNINNVNVPIRTTVLDILASIANGNQVMFQVAPIRGMRKFIIDLNQVSLVTCSRPIIYDDQTPLPISFPPLSEGWLRKQGGQNPWRVSQRPRFLIISLPSRDAGQVNATLHALEDNHVVLPVSNPVKLQEQAALSICNAVCIDDFGRETHRIPMTIYFAR